MEDVKDITNDMWSQIRAVEKKYMRSSLSSKPTMTAEATLSAMTTIAQDSRTELAEYVQEGKQAGFEKYRDQFITTLITNKQSFLTLVSQQGQTISASGIDCIKRVKIFFLQGDGLDNVNQNASVNNGRTTPVNNTYPTTKPPVQEVK